MKVVIYYEGQSERYMLKHLFIRRCQPVEFTEDYQEFLSASDNQNYILYFDCIGYENVFPMINDTSYCYASNERIIVVRDLEKTECFRELKEKLFEDCVSLPQARTRPIFAKYKLEHLYLTDLRIFRNAFRSIYRSNFGTKIPDPNRFEELVNNLNPANPDIKSLFRAYNMAFSKPYLADEFFARFNFFESRHPYFIRLFDSLRELIEFIQ